MGQNIEISLLNQYASFGLSQIEPSEKPLKIILTYFESVLVQLELQNCIARIKSKNKQSLFSTFGSPLSRDFSIFRNFTFPAFKLRILVLILVIIYHPQCTPIFYLIGFTLWGPFFFLDQTKAGALIHIWNSISRECRYNP